MENLNIAKINTVDELTLSIQSCTEELSDTVIKKYKTLHETPGGVNIHDTLRRSS